MLEWKRYARRRIKNKLGEERRDARREMIC